MSQTALERLIADYECIDTEYTSPSAELIAAARQERAEMVEALRFYAEGSHIESGPYGPDHTYGEVIEDGSRARALLAKHGSG